MGVQVYVNCPMCMERSVPFESINNGSTWVRVTDYNMCARCEVKLEKIWEKEKLNCSLREYKESIELMYKMDR